MLNTSHIDAFCEALAKKAKGENRLEDATEVIFKTAVDYASRRGFEHSAVFISRWILHGGHAVLPHLIRTARAHSVRCKEQDCNTCTMLEHHKTAMDDDRPTKWKQVNA